MVSASCRQNRMAPAVSAAEVAVFTVTSMDTRLALSVPPNITAADFKRRLETEHFGIFPEAGEIRVHGVMVNRRSCLYHLPDLMQIKYAFHGTSGAWFLYVDLRPSNDLSTPSFGDCVDVKEHKDGTASNPKVENSNANSSDVISVEGLIEKYFTSFSEVSNCSTPGPSVKLRPVQSRAKGKKKGGRKGNSSSNNQVVTSGDFLVKTPSQPLNALASINMIRRNLTEPPKRSKVGTRLVMASYSLGISPSRETVSSLCRSRSGKSSRSPLRIKCPIFDISGESDG